MLGLKSLQTMLTVKPDIIHAHLHEGALIGTVLSKLWRVPLVFDFQGSLTCEMIDHKWLAPDSPSHRFWRWLEERIDHYPDAVITSSYNAANLLRNEFGRTNGNVYTVADCVNPDTFRPDAAAPEEKAALRARYGIPADAKVVLYLGILQDYQGIPHLIRSAKLVTEQRPNTYFLILGFPNQVRYMALAAETGVADRVLLPGPVPYEDAPKYLPIADVAAAPKLSATEGAGKLLLYMSTALPIVAFDTPVSREYMCDLGMCAQPGSVEGLAQDILTLLADPEAARARGQKLRERAIENYTWVQGAERIAEVYQKVCPHPKGIV
jgi:glycosyltransferase involved in cell wall biosynthesis